MKLGAENRRQTIILAVVGVLAIGALIPLYNELFGGPAPTAAPAPPVIRDAAPPVGSATTGGAPVLAPGREGNALPAGAVGQPAALKVATTSASLDPTLHMAAMLRTESLVYEGSGRNIFFAGAAPPPPPSGKPVLERAKYDARNHAPTPPPLPPQPIGPPPPPPINLKFFGTATAANGTRRAFLLSGDNVFLASVGDVVDRRYRVVSIAANSILMEDLPNTNKQTLPLLVGN